MRASRGSVLILSLWAIGFLSLVAMALSARATALMRLHSRVMEQLQASALLPAAVQHAQFVLGQDLMEPFDGMHETWHEPRAYAPGGGLAASGGGDAGAVSWRLRDENARMPLNAAPVEMIAALVEGLTGDKRAAAMIADSLADWRDADAEDRENGAEDFYYLGLNPPYESKDAPLECEEELLLLRGMTPAIYEALREHISVYTTYLNLNAAGVPVLRSLGLSEGGSAGLVFYLAGEDNERGSGDDRAFIDPGVITAELEPYVPVEDLQRLEEMRGMLGVRAEIYRLNAQARGLHAYGTAGLEAVFDREGRLLLWKEN